MDEAGPSGQGMSGDIPQTFLDASSLRHLRRSSWNFEEENPVGISNFSSQRPTISYPSTSWTEVLKPSTSGDAFKKCNQHFLQPGVISNIGFDETASKSVDIGIGQGSSATLTRQQSLDETLDSTSRSTLYDPFPGFMNEMRSTRYSDRGPTCFPNESATRYAMD